MLRNTVYITTKQFCLDDMKIHRRFMKEGKSTISLPSDKVGLQLTLFHTNQLSPSVSRLDYFYNPLIFLKNIRT